MTALRKCLRCNQGLELRRVMDDTGFEAFMLYCKRCRANGAGVSLVSWVTIDEWQKAKKIPQDLDVIPLLTKEDFADNPPLACVVCGKTTEVSAVGLVPFPFRIRVEDYTCWPAIPLCVDHEKAWSYLWLDS